MFTPFWNRTFSFPLEAPATDKGGKTKETDDDPPEDDRSFELTIGGKKKVFANAEELKDEFTKLAKGLDDLAEIKKELTGLRQLKKDLVGYTKHDNKDAGRRMYEALGIPEAQIDEFLTDDPPAKGKGRNQADDDDEDEDDDDEDTRGSSKRGKGNPVDVNAIADAVIRKMKGNIGIDFFDKKLQGQLGDMAERTLASGEIVEDVVAGKINSAFSTDKVINRYWGRLSDRQKQKAMDNVVAAIPKLKQGRTPKPEDLGKLRDEMRNYLNDTYGEPEDFAKAHPVRMAKETPILSVEDDTPTGFETLSDRDFNKEVEKLDSEEFGTDGDDGGLLQHLNLAQERAKRAARRAG